MNKKPLRLLAAVLAAMLAAGCASNRAPSNNNTFDLGPATPGPSAYAPDPSAPPLAAVVMTDATGSAAFDSERMFYRLAYANANEARSYANSRWTITPLQMVTQRLKARIAQSGSKVLSATDASAGIPILRIEVDDFIHTFSSASQSEGQLVLRATLLRNHTLVDQKTFSRSTAAASANAAGGARALAASTDAVAADIVAWLAGLDLAQR